MRARVRPVPALLALALGLALAAGPAPARAGVEVWDPARTSVFVVGVLEYRDPDYDPFPQKERKDAVLVETLVARGVPPDRVVFLRDRDATRERIRRDLARLLAASRPGETLLFLFAGHGSRPDGGGTSFVTWDADSDRAAETTWPVAEVFDTVARAFRGTRALLMADSCYSGALAVEAARRAKGSRIRWGTLTAALSNVPSTGAWTFTDCLVDAFAGRPWVDRDRDGTIRLDELGEHVADEMAFADRQYAWFQADPSFPAGLVLTTGVEPAPEGVGERLEARDKGKWYKARVIDRVGGRPKVRWFGYTSDWDEVVDPARLRPFVPALHRVGTAVEVKWKDEWYPARVTAIDRTLHKVRYRDWGEDWDEWVGEERIRVPAAPAPARAGAAPR